jgi:bifunctional ADP-heptose synthase (sugar kinase/adenylyltransferase)
MSHKDNEKIMALIEDINPQYIIFSDYNKWMINKDLVDGIKSYADRHDLKIFVDTNQIISSILRVSTW